jgi:hypothetical protein
MSAKRKVFAKGKEEATMVFTMIHPKQMGIIGILQEILELGWSTCRNPRC